MSRIVLVALAVLAAIAVVIAFAWIRAGDRYAVTLSTSSSESFDEINPEREFVTEVIRPLLSTPLFKNAIVNTTASESPSLKAQTNIVIILTVAREISPNALYGDSLKAAASNLLMNYQDPSTGIWLSRAVGSATQKDAGSVAIARVSFALVGAYKATGDQAFLSAALSSWQQIEDSVMLAPRLAETDQIDLVTSERKSYDAHAMVAAFETMVTLHDATDDPALQADIETLARFAIKDLMKGDASFLARQYAPDLAPIKNTKGNILAADQFALAYILGRAADGGLSTLFMGPGGDLIDHTLNVAATAIGEIRTSLDSVKGTVVDTTPSTAASAEAARATAHYAYLRGRSDLWQRFNRLYPTLRRQIMTTGDVDALARAALLYSEIIRLRGGAHSAR